MSSGAASTDRISMDTANESETITTPMAVNAEVSDEMNFDAVCEFLRDNAGMVIQKIMSSNEWKDSMQAHEDSIMALSEENRELRNRLAIAEGALTRCEITMRKLEEKVVDLTSRSMRDNLIIKNVSEEQNEKDTDIEQKLRTTLRSELNIPEQEMKSISIQRAHRVGKQSRDRPRNIVAKLNSKGKSVVMRHLRNLNKQSKVKITEQYPPEIHANREKLWPMFLEAKKQGKAARWQADKLHIDGRVHHPPKDRNRDINLDTVEEALKLKTQHTAVTSKNGNHFQAHVVDISTTDQVIPAIKALCADSRIAGASHVAYAYRTGRESYSISNYQDDGEWGAGKRIMEGIKNSNSYNILVCVTCWYGGSLMGPSRFDVIKELSNEAIQISGYLK